MNTEQTGEWYVITVSKQGKQPITQNKPKQERNSPMQQTLVGF